MSLDFCCTLWKSVSGEIRQSYLDQLQEAQDKGVPAFTLLPQRDAIENWGLHCPRCGKSTILPTTALAPTPITITPVKQTVRKVCHICQGKKIIAGQGTADPIRCIKCWGLGYLDEQHQLDDSGGSLGEIQVPKGLEKTE